MTFKIYDGCILKDLQIISEILCVSHSSPFSLSTYDKRPPTLPLKNYFLSVFVELLWLNIVFVILKSDIQIEAIEHFLLS